MEDFIKHICKLCDDVVGNNFTVIEDCTKEMCRALQLKHDFENDGTNVICTVCSEKLFAAYEFKSTCLQTENSIKTHVYCEERLPLDMGDIYMKEIDNKQLVGTLEDKKICRLCMELITDNFTPIQDIDPITFQSYFPEINFNFTKDPVVCKVCYDSLHKHVGFLEKCTKIETEFTENKHTVWIKNEHGESENSEILRGIDTSIVKSETNEDDRTKESFEPQQLSNPENVPEPQLHESNLKKHSLVHEDKSQPKLYKCAFCGFQTKCRKTIQDHLEHHKGENKNATIAEVPTYKCSVCDYRSKYKHHLTSHLLKHKDLSEVVSYKCKKCTFETKYKRNIVQHQLVHKKVSEIEFHKCTECLYMTKRKKTLLKHQKTHHPLAGEKQSETGDGPNEQERLRDDSVSQQQGETHDERIAEGNVKIENSMEIEDNPIKIENIEQDRHENVKLEF